MCMRGRTGWTPAQTGIHRHADTAGPPGRRICPSDQGLGTDRDASAARAVGVSVLLTLMGS